MDLLLAKTDPAHNLEKSDLNSTLNLIALSPRRRQAIDFPLPIHIMARLPVLMAGALGVLGSSFPLPLIQHSTASLEWYFKQEAKVAAFNSTAGDMLINDFFQNTAPKREIPYPLGSELSKVVTEHEVFNQMAREFEDAFFARVGLSDLNPKNKLQPADMEKMVRTGGRSPAPGMPFFTVGDPLGILGSFQEIDVRLVTFIDQGDKIDMTFQYDLFDHFGCDDSDLEGLPTHGTPGQIAMWLLARDPKHGPGHKPFVVKITAERKTFMYKRQYQPSLNLR